MERFTEKLLDGSYDICSDTKCFRVAPCYDENGNYCFSVCEGAAIDKLGEYEDLDEQGLLLKLPCAVGSAVYAIDFTFECKYNYACREEYWCERGILCEYEYKEYYVRETKFQLSMIETVGKTVFLTRKEAEKALKAMEKGGAS